MGGNIRLITADLEFAQPFLNSAIKSPQRFQTFLPADHGSIAQLEVEHVYRLMQRQILQS